jgi:hypothetical protein
MCMPYEECLQIVLRSVNGGSRFCFFGFTVILRPDYY